MLAQMIFCWSALPSSHSDSKVRCALRGAGNLNVLPQSNSFAAQRRARLLQFGSVVKRARALVGRPHNRAANVPLLGHSCNFGIQIIARGITKIATLLSVQSPSRAENHPRNICCVLSRRIPQYCASTSRELPNESFRSRNGGVPLQSTTP